MAELKHTAPAAGAALGDTMDVAIHVRTQATKWRSSLREIEDIMSCCVHADGQIDDLLTRLRAPQEYGQSDLEIGQEVIIWSRIREAEVKGIEVQTAPAKTKTQQQRRMELLELRHELAKTDEVGLDASGPRPSLLGQAGFALSSSAKGSSSQRPSLLGQAPIASSISVKASNLRMSTLSPAPLGRPARSNGAKGRIELLQQ